MKMTTQAPKRIRTKEQIAANNKRQYARDMADPKRKAARRAKTAANKRKSREPVKAARLKTEQELAAQAVTAEMANRILSRRRLLPFIKRLDDKYSAGWAHADICRRLERFSDDVAKGLSPRLMLLMPPRFGKSRIASQSFPAWHLGQYPSHEFISCSYNISLALTFSRKVQALIESPDYRQVFSETTLDANNKSAESWGLTGESGGYVAAGVGGGITGKGAHVLVIDDPVKNAEEADSTTTREAIKEWYGSTAYTRLAPGGGVLVIQTCWHDDDLAGWLQNTMRADDEADQFEVVKYPAIAEADEYLDPATDEIVRIDPLAALMPPNASSNASSVSPGVAVVAGLMPPNAAGFTLLRKKGEALHPERYDITKLNRIKKTLSPRFWSALYQQNPVPDDGTYFSREQFKRAGLPAIRHCNVYVAWDFAISEKQANDYTVGIVGLQDVDDTLHVADMVRFKSGDAFFIVDAIIALAKKWQHPSLRMGFEDGQIFRAIQTLLKKRMREENLAIPYEVLKPLSDKMVRARPLQGRMQQGMVSFDAAALWFDTIMNEMLRFPAGVHDDTVDALAWLMQLAINSEPPRVVVPKHMKSWKDKIKGHGRSSRSYMTA